MILQGTFFSNYNSLLLSKLNPEIKSSRIQIPCCIERTIVTDGDARQTHPVQDLFSVKKKKRTSPDAKKERNQKCKQTVKNETCRGVPY